VTCPNKTTQGAAFWVGIDGLQSTDPTIEQIGTAAQCVKGKPKYYTWYEMYPAAAVVVSKPVAPGDVFNAIVKGSGKKFTLQISATSGGKALWGISVVKTASSAPKVASAEWIAEAPCTGSPCKLLPLADFGTVNFSKLAFAGKATNTKIGFTQTQITMATKGVVRAQPSALTNAGSAFSIAWLHN
jgi:hypothetical protein